MLWTLVQVSRPGFWIITIWCYVVGLQGQGISHIHEPVLWLGLFYAAFPANALLYAWNDLNDADLDRHNPRKGAYLLGISHLSNQETLDVFQAAFAINLGFLFALGLMTNLISIVGWFICACITNYAYNNFPCWREGPAPFDFVGPMGYLLFIWFAAIVNDLHLPSVATFAFHLFMVMRSQLWGQIIDLGPDVKARRQTTAVVLGIKGARALLACLVFCELCVAIFSLGNQYVILFSALSMFTALLELFIYPSRSPSLQEAALTGMLMTPAAGVLLLHLFVATSDVPFP